MLIRDEATIKLIQTSSGDLAHDYVSQLALWDRSQYTPGYDRAAEWIVGKAKEFGLEQVEVERYPSDGKVDYFGNPTQKIWTVKKAELWMTSPFEARITSYAEVPMSLARNSSSANVEAEVVDIGAGMSDDYKKDLKGKIVLTTVLSGAVQQEVLKRGALGVITSWSVPDFDYLNRMPGDFPDEIGWGRVPVPSENTQGSFMFLISSRRAQELKSLLQVGRPLRVRAVVDAQFSDGSINVVSGLIRGSKYPNEEIVVTAHLDHYKPGASDNASGSAATLEMVRTLNQLIAEKVIPRPHRTIRFLWLPEYAGSWAWFSKHLGDPVKRLANLNFDMIGENLKVTNAIFAMMYTPDYNPSYVNGIMESILDFMNKYNDERYPPQKDFHIISVTGSRDRLQGRMFPYETGTDHEVFNNAGIPGTGPLAWPDYFYHSSEDTPDKVDPTQLHRVIFTGLGALSVLAYADDQNSADIARLALMYAKKRIAISESEAEGFILSSSKDNFSGNAVLAANVVKHVYAREREAVKSALAFSRGTETKKVVEQVAAMLDDDEKGTMRNVDDFANMRGKELGVARKASTLSDAERRASHLIPVREKGKELYSVNYVFEKAARDSTLMKIYSALTQTATDLQQRGVSSLRLMGLFDAPARLADGKRSVLDIRDAFAADFGLTSIDALTLYFRAFEKAGVMKIMEK
jgi:Zn-dependent M28 family amino/carboxypeptidase